MVESVKAASDVYAPISGEVIEVNEALAAEPALVNSDAGGKAWFFKLRIADKSELGGMMDEAAYKPSTRLKMMSVCDHTLAVIAAAWPGDSSTPRPFGSIADFPAYWIPRLRGV